MGKPPEPRDLRRDIPDTLRELLLKSVELDRKKRQKNFGELKEELNTVYQELYGSDAPSYQLELHDTTADELNNQGYSYYELGKMEEARRCFEAAVEVNNTHPEAVFNLALLQWRGGEIDDLDALRKVRNCLNHTSGRKKKISELLAYIQAERLDPALAKEELKEYQGRYEDLFGGITIRRLELIRTVEGHGESVNFVFLSADGKYAISETSGMDQDDNTPKLWDVSTGQCLRTFDWAYSSERFISLSADGRYAISASDSEVSLGLWEMSTGHLLRTFEGHSSLVQSVSLSADGKYALSGSADKTLKLWEVSTGRCLRIFVGHSGDVYSVCLSTDGKYALSGSGDNTLKLWEVSTGLCLRTFVGHIGWVVSVSLSADGKYALSRSEDNTLKLWEVSTGRSLRTIEGWWYRDYACSVILTADGRYAILGGGDKKLMLWEININSHSYNSELKVSDFKAFDEIKGVQDELKYAIEEAGRLMNNGNNTKAFTTLYNAWEKDDFRDRTELLTVYQKLYQLSSIKSFSFAYKINSFEGHSRTVNSVILSADGRYALSGSMDKTLKLWDVSTGLCLRTFDGHSSDVNSVCLSTNGKYALSGSADKTLKLWDVLTGRCLGTFVNSWWDGGDVNSVCLIANGKSALSGSTDKTLKLWDVSTSQCLRTFQGHSSTVTSVSLSADERYALSGSDDKTLKLWDVSTGQCLRTFEGRGYVCSVCLSADGRYALSGSRDNTLKLWETETGECVHNFEGHTNSVYSVALSADGKYALSGSSDDTIKLFRLIWKLEFDE
jgi:WD40 repeat protein